MQSPLDRGQGGLLDLLGRAADVDGHARLVGLQWFEGAQLAVEQRRGMKCPTRCSTRDSSSSRLPVRQMKRTSG